MFVFLFQTWRSEGFMALYKGFFPNWLRLGPWNIIVSFQPSKLCSDLFTHISSVMQYLLEKSAGSSCKFYYAFNDVRHYEPVVLNAS